MRRRAERIPAQTGIPARTGQPHEHTIARLDARESAAPFHRPEWRTFSTGSRGSYGRGVRRPNSDAAHRLRERISVAGECESILAIVAAEHGEFTARIAATACHRLAKLSQANRNGPRMADPRAGLLLSVATKVSASMNAQEVANTVWALAKLEWQAGDGTMRALEGAAVRLASSMNAQAVVNTVWGLATLGWQVEDETMRALEGAAVRLAPSMIAQGVANTVWALAKLGRQAEDETMRALEGAAIRLAPSMKPQNVANTVWALATLGWQSGEDTMRALEGAAVRLAPSMNAQNVANVLSPSSEPGVG